MLGRGAGRLQRGGRQPRGYSLAAAWRGLLGDGGGVGSDGWGCRRSRGWYGLAE